MNLKDLERTKEGLKLLVDRCLRNDCFYRTAMTDFHDDDGLSKD